VSALPEPTTENQGEPANHTPSAKNQALAVEGRTGLGVRLFNPAPVDRDRVQESERAEQQHEPANPRPIPLGDASPTSHDAGSVAERGLP
jgi:hypothetical protein